MIRMRADRLLAMMLVLQARGRVTARALADELQVSVRTVYRDLDALSAAGVPVLAEPGQGGGCQLMSGFRTPLAGLTPEEAQALLLLGTPQPLHDLGLTPAWQMAQRKLASALSPASGEAEPLLKVHLDVQTWFPAQDDIRQLPTLALAIRQGRRLAMRYARDAETNKRYVIEPLGLVNKAGIWYVVTRDRDRTLAYRVGRIQSAEVLDSSFVVPADFDLVAAWAAWSTDFVSSLPRLEVTLRVSPNIVPILPQVLGDQVHQHLASAEPQDATGWRTLRLPFEHPHAACHRLLGFGDQVEVLAPASVRELMRRTAEAAVNVYRTPKKEV